MALFSYLGKTGDFATASKVMEKMIKEGLRPSVVTYGAIIHAYCSKKNVEEACRPDYITMEVLTEWLSAVGEIEKLKHFVEGYQDSSYPASSQT